MLRLPETLTLDHASAAQAALAQALRTDAGAAASIDASGLRRLDSAALAVLLACRRLAQAAGKGFAVHGAPPKLAELARLYGLDALLTLAAPPSASPDRAQADRA